VDLRNIETLGEVLSHSNDFAVEIPATVTKVETEAKEVTSDALAKQVVDLLANKELSITQIAEHVGVNPKALTRPDMKARIHNLLTEGYVIADVQRAAVRAGRFKIFMDMMEDGLKQGDVASLKVALEASKQIGMDPEIGLSQAPQQVVNIDLGPLTEILKKTQESEHLVIDMEEEEDGFKKTTDS